MLNIIRIKKAVFYGYHGVLSEEKSVGGKFEADIDLFTNFRLASEHDSLRETIDYGKVYKFAYKLALEEKHALIETLAMKIADGLLQKFLQAEKVAVRIRKNNPPLGGIVDCVEVEVIKDRSELKV